MPKLEICVATPGSIGAAHEGGADRVELCAGLETGGLTPSAGLAEAALARDIPHGVRALVRPRPGGFVYSPEEVAVMVSDIRRFVTMGVQGIVVGALTDTGDVDLDALRRFVDAADGRGVTFHRAVDLLADQGSAMVRLAAEGVDTVLTSGGHPTAPAGVQQLAALHAAGGPTVMAGGGIGLHDVPGIVETGVPWLHASASELISGAPTGPGAGGNDYRQTSVEAVRALRTAADSPATAFSDRATPTR